MSRIAATLTPFALPLRQPLATARGVIGERRGWLFRLRDADGLEGHGTAMPIDGFGGESFDACGDALAAALAGGGGRSAAAIDPERAPFAAAAWSLARADLEARRSARPLAACLREGIGSARTSVPVNALIGGADAAAVREAVRRAHGFPVLKLKVGADVGAALALVDAACEALGEGQRLRVDPNASWSETEAARALAVLDARRVEYVEQPVPSTHALARLRAAAGVKVAADESASDAAGLRGVVAGRVADVVVMKPMRLGGPEACVRLGAHAQAAGIGVAVTSLLDSAIGVRAALAVALALPADPLACGLATGDLFALDLVAPPATTGPGRMRGWHEPGLGTVVDEAALRETALAPGREGWAG